MECVAVFVDAGYFFAQGSVCINGQKIARRDLEFKPIKAVEMLKNTAFEVAPQAKLLRVYWYDGATPGTTRSIEHETLARMNDVKLRLGFINREGQQKGVDSLIVTDLIELARLKSVSEALLVSGDEDVRIGVQIAQNYGVRVHLLGIHPARGSQSPQLMDEADTTIEWTKDQVKEFLELRRHEPENNHLFPVEKLDSTQNLIQSDINFDMIAATYKKSLIKNDLETLQMHFKTNRDIPSDCDRNLLFFCQTLPWTNA